LHLCKLRCREKFRLLASPSFVGRLLFQTIHDVALSQSECGRTG